MSANDLIQIQRSKVVRLTRYRYITTCGQIVDIIDRKFLLTNDSKYETKGVIILFLACEIRLICVLNIMFGYNRTEI